MKKAIGLMMGLLVLLLACACFAEEHVCEVAFPMFMDDKECWDECSCGERLNVREHQWKEGNWGSDCTVCGAVLLQRGEAVQVTLEDEHYNTLRRYRREEDGYISVEHYSEDGETVLRIEVIPMGDVVMTERVENEYLEDGSYRSRQYQDGVLLYEALYVREQQDGYVAEYPAECKVFLEDGGWVIQKSSSSAGVDEETLYDAAGIKLFTVTYERSYDSEGNEIVTQYMDGKLYRILEYATADMGDYVHHYIAKETVYDENGNATVTMRDQYGNILE